MFCFLYWLIWLETVWYLYFHIKTRKTRVSRFKLSKCDWRPGREKSCVLKNEENQIVFYVAALCSIQVVPSFATPIDGALSAFTVVGLVWTPYCIVKPAKPIQFFKNLIPFGKFGPPNDSAMILTHPVPEYNITVVQVIVLTECLLAYIVYSYVKNVWYSF